MSDYTVKQFNKFNLFIDCIEVSKINFEKKSELNEEEEDVESFFASANGFIRLEDKKTGAVLVFDWEALGGTESYQDAFNFDVFAEGDIGVGFNFIDKNGDILDVEFEKMFFELVNKVDWKKEVKKHLPKLNKKIFAKDGS